jgi:hypothetical protein
MKIVLLVAINLGKMVAVSSSEEYLSNFESAILVHYLMFGFAEG